MCVVILNHSGPSPYLPQKREEGSCKGPVESLVPDVSGLRGPLGKEMANEYPVGRFYKKANSKEGQTGNASFVMEDGLF